MKWCMINNTAPDNDATTWLREYDPIAKSGAMYDHEDPNPPLQLLFVVTPPAELLAGVEIPLVFNTELAETDHQAAVQDLFEQSTNFKLDNSSNVLTGERWMWEAMYKLPESRLWENNYESV